MYYRYNAGGRNKEKGQVEQCPRVDSFDITQIQGYSFTMCGNEAIDVAHWEDDDFCYIFASDMWEEILLSKKRNGFGGEQTFFLCPLCGERVRYLYLNGHRLRCRKCSKLNYRSQQETKNDMADYRKGMEYAREYLALPRWNIDGFEFDYIIPGKPRGMHSTTYRHHLKRFYKYQSRYREKQVDQMMKLLKMMR